MILSIFGKKERRKDRSELPVNALRKLLDHMARENGFKAAMVATEGGFISVNVDSRLSADQLSEIGRLVWSFARSVCEVGPIDDFQKLLMSNMDGDEALICRSFVVQKKMMVLIALTTADMPYDDIIGNAEQGITRIISQ